MCRIDRANFLHISFILQNSVLSCVDGKAHVLVSMIIISGVWLRVLEHPPQLWHNSTKLSGNCLCRYRHLVARIKNKLTGLQKSLSKQLFLVATWPKQPSLSASYLLERVSEGRGQHFGAGLNFFARAPCARLA